MRGFSGTAMRETADQTEELESWQVALILNLRKRPMLAFWTNERRRKWERRQRERLTSHSYGSDEDIFRYLRIGRRNGHDGDTALPTAGWERYRPHQQPQHDLQTRLNLEWLDQSTTPAPTFAVGPTMRAWLLGTALVALVLVVAHGIDKCLLFKFGKSRRRSLDSQEWQTQNVRATNRHMVDNGTVIIPGLENLEPLTAEHADTATVDLPPPYSECMSAGTHNKEVTNSLTEAPPSYTDSYAEFSNKNGIPSVLIVCTTQTPLVNPRDIIGFDTVSNDKTKKTTKKNTNHTSVEVAKGARRIDENSGEIPYIDGGSGYTQSIPGTSSSQPTVAMNDDENTQGKVEQLPV